MESAGGLNPLLDTSLTELEALEKKIEDNQIEDGRVWPALTLALRKLATTSVELINMPETRNRTNRSQFISFCARLKAIALVFQETLTHHEQNKINSLSGSNQSGNITPSSSIKHSQSSKQFKTLPASASPPLDELKAQALLLPELQLFIQKIAANSPEVTTLEWVHPSKLGPHGMNALATPLNWRNTYLTTLKISNNAIGNLGLSYLSKALKSNRTITHLDISQNSISANGIEYLVDCLLNSANANPNNVLAKLDLSHNLLDFAACGFIARLLMNVYGLKELLLNNNLINDVGITTIGNSLAMNCGLTRLDLHQNPSTHTFAAGPIFATVLLQSNYDLQELNLGSAKTSEDDMKSIDACLKRNQLIQQSRISAKSLQSSDQAYSRVSDNTSLNASGQHNHRLHIFSPSVLSRASLLKFACSPNSSLITSIIATDCNLTSVPPQLCLLGAHLEVLDLRRNKLTTLPTEIKAFFKLHTLHLAHNRFQYIPNEVSQLISLGTISLHGNPLQWIPQDVVRHAELEDYPPVDTSLFKFLKESAKTIDENHESKLFGKIMIMGTVHSGKTSLIQLLESDNGREESFIDAKSPGKSDKSHNWNTMMPRYTSTEGIHIRQIQVKGSKFGSEFREQQSNAPLVSSEAMIINKSASYQVWECGGSEVFSASHSIFYSHDFLYLITTDLSKVANPETCQDCLSSIKTMISTLQAMIGSSCLNPDMTRSELTGTAPYISIVGTFEDTLTPEQLQKSLELLKHYFAPHVIEILAVSNKSAKGLAILRDRVLLWSQKSKLLTNPKFGSISTIQSVLKSYSATKPFISRLELEHICQTYGIGTEVSQDSNVGLRSATTKVDTAIHMLEKVGSVLTLHADTHLQSYSFIDPQFAANIFSDIMSSSDADGYIYRSHIPPLLWMDCRKHASMRSLFEWCRLFGVAIDFGSTHFIIPSLLNSQPSISVYNSAWPQFAFIEGISSRPGSLAPGTNKNIRHGHQPSLSKSNAPKTSQLVQNHFNHRFFEWPVLVRSLEFEFVPALVFSHIMTTLFSLPGIQRCAWWRNGFIIRRDYESCQVTRERSSDSSGTNSLSKSSYTRILIQVRNDSTFAYSSALLNEVSDAIRQKLAEWYPQIDYSWTVPYHHPCLPEEEDEDVISHHILLQDLKEKIAMGMHRQPTVTNYNLTIIEELLCPELVNYNLYFQQSPSQNQSMPYDLHENDISEDEDSEDSDSSGPGQEDTITLISHRKRIDAARKRFVKDLKLCKLEDGTIVRHHQYPSREAANSYALHAALLRNERIATLLGVLTDPPGVGLGPGVATIVPNAGCLDFLLTRTYLKEPLSMLSRLRIAADVALALKFIHSQVPVIQYHGLDSNSIYVGENYTDPNTKGSVVRLDLGAISSQSWLTSLFCPKPYTSTTDQTTTQRVQVSPYSADIYALGVVLLQLWRNEPYSIFMESCPPDPSLQSTNLQLPPFPYFSPESKGYAQLEQLIACCTCEDPRMRPNIEQVLSSLHSIATDFEHHTVVQLLAPTVTSRRWRKIKTVHVSNETKDGFNTVNSLTKTNNIPLQISMSTNSPNRGLQKVASLGNTNPDGKSPAIDETIIWSGGANGILYGIPLPSPSSSYSSISLASLTQSILESSCVQYSIITYPADTRDSRKRIISTSRTTKNLWCLLNSVLCAVIDPVLKYVVAHVEIGPCLSMAAYDDTVYTGGTNGLLSSYDGSKLSKINSIGICNLAITAIAANHHHVWIALSDRPGVQAKLVCLDALTFKEIGSISHSEEETVTALQLVRFSSPGQPTVEYLWTGGYSGVIQIFKASFSQSDDGTKSPRSSSPPSSPREGKPQQEQANTSSTTGPHFSCIPYLTYAVHGGRIQHFSTQGDFLYSSSEDAIVIWKPDGSKIVGKLLSHSRDISCFVVVDKNVIVSGSKLGNATIWSS